jgi:hypothetical protein
MMQRSRRIYSGLAGHNEKFNSTKIKCQYFTNVPFSADLSRLLHGGECLKFYYVLFNTPSACGGVSVRSLSQRERARLRGNIIG